VEAYGWLTTPPIFAAVDNSPTFPWRFTVYSLSLSLSLSYFHTDIFRDFNLADSRFSFQFLTDHRALLRLVRLMSKSCYKIRIQFTRTLQVNVAENFAGNASLPVCEYAKR